MESKNLKGHFKNIVYPNTSLVTISVGISVFLLFIIFILEYEGNYNYDETNLSTQTY
jgi:hypothetical protein